MHANQNLWGTEHAKAPFIHGIRDPGVGVCAKPRGRPQKTLACRPSNVLAGRRSCADDVTTRFQSLHPNDPHHRPGRREDVITKRDIALDHGDSGW